MLVCRQAIAVTFLGFAALIALGNPATAQSRVISTMLTGAAEKPSPGALGGYGAAGVVANPDGGYVCFSLYTSQLATPTAAHIHKGGVNEAGPVVVPLTTPVNGSARGCVDAEASLVRDIVANPTSYYINVHNADFPSGAIRGQLIPK